MRIPEIAYRYLYPIDVASPTLELVTRELSSTLTNALVELSLTGIPTNKILVLSNVTLLADPGATQSVTFLEVAAFTGAGARFLIAQERPVAVADQNRVLNWQGECWIPGRGDAAISVTVGAGFSAGVAGNNLVLGLFGSIIPRGNMAMF